MKLKLKNVKPNPFRHLDRYPIREEKIAALKKSIEDTDFWENIVARKVGDGKIEIAYGHHRMEALRQMYPDTTEFDFIIKDIDDTNMCKIMAHENMEEWGSDAFVEQETIRAIVQGYADGRVELGDIAPTTHKTKTRYAPSFTQGGESSVSDDYPYTTTQLVDFLGWKEWKVKAALASLEKIESNMVDENVYKDKTTEQQAKITTEVNKVQRRSETAAKKAESEGDDLAAKVIRKKGMSDSKRVAKGLSKAFDGDEKGDAIGTRDAPIKAREILDDGNKDEPEYPDINPITGRLAIKIEHLLDDDKELGKKVREIIKHRNLLESNYRSSLQMSLRILADAANELANNVMK